MLVDFFSIDRLPLTLGRLLLYFFPIASSPPPNWRTVALNGILTETCRFNFAVECGASCHDGHDITATLSHARTSRPIHRIFCTPIWWCLGDKRDTRATELARQIPPLSPGPINSPG